MAIIIGDANNVGAGDAELEEILDDLEIDADFCDDNDDRRDCIDDQDDFQAVFISGSVNAAVLNDEYKNEDIPILVMDDETYPEMDMTDENDGADFGQENESEIEIEEDGHPLAAGLDSDEDEIEVVDQDEQLNFGEVEGDGEEIATLAGGGDTCIFTYEKDAEMNDENTAEERRTGIFVTDQFADDLSADGEALLEAAIIYTLTGRDRL